jgi:hypothetical protein
MNTKALALKLNGREIGREITREEATRAKENGLVVVYGYSDDTMEIDGAISAEAGAFRGNTIYVTRGGIVELETEDCDCCKYFQTAKKRAKAITAVWHDEGGPVWTYETDIPHETFDIMEEGEVFCRGIVFSIEDVESKIDALLKLVEENPALPIVPMVDGEIVAGDNFGTWMGRWGDARVDKYLIPTKDYEPMIFKSDDDVADTLEKYLSAAEFDALPEDESECRQLYDALPWTKAIIVSIDLPD